MAITVILLIIALFFFFLFVKEIFDLRLCALCLSVSGTWVIFLLFHWFSNITLPVIVIILMGETAVGLFYLMKRHVNSESPFHFFQLPILLTITLAIYTMIESQDIVMLLIILGSVWIFFGVSYLFRNQSEFINQSVKKIIACCKDW